MWDRAGKCPTVVLKVAGNVEDLRKRLHVQKRCYGQTPAGITQHLEATTSVMSLCIFKVAIQPCSSIQSRHSVVMLLLNCFTWLLQACACMSLLTVSPENRADIWCVDVCVAWFILAWCCSYIALCNLLRGSQGGIKWRFKLHSWYLLASCVDHVHQKYCWASLF